MAMLYVALWFVGGLLVLVLLDEVVLPALKAYEEEDSSCP